MNALRFTWDRRNSIGAVHRSSGTFDMRQAIIPGNRSNQPLLLPRGRRGSASHRHASSLIAASLAQGRSALTVMHQCRGMERGDECIRIGSTSSLKESRRMVWVSRGGVFVVNPRNVRKLHAIFNRSTRIVQVGHVKDILLHRLVVLIILVAIVFRPRFIGTRWKNRKGRILQLVVMTKELSGFTFSPRRPFEPFQRLCGAVVVVVARRGCHDGKDGERRSFWIRIFRVYHPRSCDDNPRPSSSSLSPFFSLSCSVRVGLKRGYEVVGLRTVSGTSIFPPMFFLFFGECVPRAVVVYICHRILHGIRMTTVNDWFTYRDLPNCKLTAHQNSQGTRRKRKVEGRRTRSRIDWGEAMSQCIPLHMLGNSLLFPEVWF